MADHVYILYLNIHIRNTHLHTYNIYNMCIKNK